MSDNHEGIIVILSSPSGAGKTSLVKEISTKNNYSISVSHTTRKPRANEIDGVDYYFVKQEEFGSEISDSDAEKILTVGDAVKFIENKAN